MTNFHDFLNEQLRDPEIRAEYDVLKPEFSLMQAMNEGKEDEELTRKLIRLSR